MSFCFFFRLNQCPPQFCRLCYRFVNFSTLLLRWNLSFSTFLFLKIDFIRAKLRYEIFESDNFLSVSSIFFQTLRLSAFCQQCFLRFSQVAQNRFSPLCENVYPKFQCVVGITNARHGTFKNEEFKGRFFNMTIYFLFH